MTHLKESRILDSDGNKTNTFAGSVDIHDADVHKNPISLIMSQATGVSTNPTAGITAEDTGFTLSSATGWTQDDLFHLEETGVPDGAVNYKMNVLAGAVVTTDQPIDKSYTTAAEIVQVLENMAVDGT